MQILLCHAAQPLIPDYNAMPFGFFFSLARGLVLPRFGRSDAKVDDGLAVLSAANFWVAAKIADEKNFIDAAGHVMRPPSLSHNCG